MQGFFNWLLNQFFPIKCIICGKEGHTVCDRCIVGCKFSPKWLGFERFKVWTAFSYKNKVAQQIVQNWKYSGNKKIINNLLDLIDYPKFQDLDYLVPVPLHRRRKVERGFNQASQMAQLMSSQLNIEYIDCLKRTKYTKPQAQLDKSERRNNLKNCIELSDQIQHCLNATVFWLKQGQGKP